ncbi:MAG: S8 family serine peptidase, partial [Cyanobacteria bacterium SBLK]|nr:S8 family serine peptidase [Cyanobacteria bacterium SBLK]
NVVDAWDLGYSGEDIVVAVVDDGIKVHPALIYETDGVTQRYREDLDRDLMGIEGDIPLQKLFFTTRPNPSATAEEIDNWVPQTFFNPLPDISIQNNIHGTAVAGLIGASGVNGEARGVAYESSLTSVKLFDTEYDTNLNQWLEKRVSDRQIADAMVSHLQEIHILNNSWQPDRPFANLPNTIAALHQGIEFGRGGLGSIYVFAGGNSGFDWENVNYNPLANSRYTIAVGAIDHYGKQSWYSNPGASLIVVAPSSSQYGDNKVGIVTTDHPPQGGYNPNDFYTDDFGGTSVSAALTSGVIALMLEANPTLTWRDVQHILVETAKKVDENDEDWEINAAGHDINHKYGFGLIDATAAVTSAQQWEAVAEEVAISSPFQTIVNGQLPDNNGLGLSSTINIEEDIIVESVEVVFDADLFFEDPTQVKRGNIELVLTSPDGTKSVLAEPNYVGQSHQNWLFTSVRNWGESSQGNWQLDAIDRVTGDTAIWNEWKINLYGTEGETTIDPFESGYFTVGATGEVTFDFIFDGGKNKGELAIFSLEGMEDYVESSEDFIREAAHRSLSNSEEGRVMISDRLTGARFSGNLGEKKNWNSGTYSGPQTSQMNPGDRFGLMFVGNGTVEQVTESVLTEPNDEGKVKFVETLEHQRLRQSGIVTKDSEGNLKVYNRIYENIFSPSWVEIELQIL